jgi:deazaflavin-dependent oxidoreductase (nitroreductase family)
MASAKLKSALEGASEIELSVTGRRSGRQITNPVWFVTEEDRLYLLPVYGSDSDWYRNVLKTPAIGIAAGGAETAATANPITDPGKASEVADKFRAKYGADQVARYYEKLDAAVEVPLG